MYFSLPVLLFPFAFSLHALVAAAPVPTKSTFTFGMPEYKGTTQEELQQHVTDTQHVQKVETEIRSQLDALHGHLTHAIANPNDVHPSITDNFGHGANHQAILDKVTAMGKSNEKISHFRDPNMGKDELAVHNSAHGIRFNSKWHDLPPEVAASVAIHEISHGQGTKDHHYYGHPLDEHGQPQTHLPKAWHAISEADVEKHKPHGDVKVGYMDHRDDHKHLVDHASGHTHLNADSYFGAAHQALHGTNAQTELDKHWRRTPSPPGSPPKPAKLVDSDGEAWDDFKKHGHSSTPHGTPPHPAPHHDTHKRG